MHDPVNNPSHYVGDDPTYECIKVAEAWGFHRCAYLFNVLKYICRAGKKDPRKVIEDLKKAIFYLQRKIMTLEKEQEKYLLEEQIGSSPYKHHRSMAPLIGGAASVQGELGFAALSKAARECE